MSKPTKSMKKPVDLSREDKDPSFFDIPPAIKKELDEKGLEGRWINSIRYQRDYGYHKSGWRAYKSDRKLNPGSFDFGEGVDSEGFIRRGDLILAVKNKEAQAKHRAKIESKTKRLNQFTKQAATELREKTKGLGQVFEGYEENDGKDDE